jgi:uncharacterized protein YoaH (UPF0181 family)
MNGQQKALALVASLAATGFSATAAIANVPVIAKNLQKPSIDQVKTAQNKAVQGQRLLKASFTPSLFPAPN